MKRVAPIAILVVVPVVLLMMATTAEDGLETRVRKLELLVERLDQRIDRLANQVKRVAAAPSTPGAPQAATMTSGDVVILIETIERLPIDEDRRADGEALVELAREKDQTADQKYAEAAGVPTGTTDRAKRYYRGVKDRLRREANSLRQQARKLQGLGMRMIREATQPKHEIVGWDGTRIVIVQALRFDATAVLRNMSMGDFAICTGDTVSESRDELVLDAQSIRPTQRPAGFNMP